MFLYICMAPSQAFKHFRVWLCRRWLDLDLEPTDRSVCLVSSSTTCCSTAFPSSAWWARSSRCVHESASTGWRWQRRITRTILIRSRCLGRSVPSSCRPGKGHFSCDSVRGRDSTCRRYFHKHGMCWMYTVLLVSANLQPLSLAKLLWQELICTHARHGGRIQDELDVHLWVCHEIQRNTVWIRRDF